MKTTKALCQAFVFAGGLLAITANAASFNPLNVDLNRLGGFAKNVQTAATPLPEKDEIAIGRELAGRTMGAAPLINDQALQSYVNRVGRAIAAQSTRPDLPWRFGVIDAPTVNAFATPGGIILISRGLYEILDNEAQLAGVLGHEVAHVDKYHHASVIRKQAGTQALFTAGQEVVAQRGVGGAFSPALQQIIGTGAEFLTKGLDRGAETEADSVGVLLAAKAGYSPAGFIDVLHKLNARAGSASTNLLTATHPHPRDRLVSLGDFLEKQMATLPPGEEPSLQVAADSLPAPVVRTAGQPVSGNRALSPEPQQAAQQPPASGGGLPSNLSPGQGAGGGGTFDPGSLLRGIIRR